MLQAYSNNVTVNTATPVPLNTVVAHKGCSEQLSGVASVQLNECGVYKVDVNATVAASAAAGTLGLQLYVNGIPLAQAISQTTATGTTDAHALSFSTFVQVSNNNNNCPCTAPTVVTLNNIGVAANVLTANMVVVPWCLC